jgi:hypothetical protein
MPINYLIPYVPLKGHVDPDFKEMAYGEGGRRAITLKKNVSAGSYMFFHTKIGSDKYITGYICLNKIMTGKEARKIPAINCDGKFDDFLFIGNRNKSRLLKKPILFNQRLANKLSLNINFEAFNNKEKTELRVIASATRAHRQLTNADVEVLLSEISKYEINLKYENSDDVQKYLYFYSESDKIIPLSDVYKIHESDIQKLLRKYPALIEKGLSVIDHEKVLPDGDRLDLLLEGKDGSIVVAELKGPNCLTDSIPTQLASYVRDIQREYPKRQIRKMIICDGKVSPKLQKACEALAIEIVVYGMKLECFKLV